MVVAAFQPQDIVGLSLAGDRYEVIDQLGEGSMAFVYRAWDERLQTDVVIKIPRPEKITDADFLVRFRRESQLLVRLSNPNVVSILDVGEHDDLPYVVMQYLSGGTLKDRIQDSNETGHSLKVGAITGWIREIARALDFCHGQQIVHRDVKPANILFDDHGNAFLSDFGLTKILSGDHRDQNSEMTAAGFVVGTPNYVAPEIVLGAHYDGAADQYSLGITLYHALTGSPPMQGASSSATMVNQTQRELPLLSRAVPGVSQKVAEAIDRAIRKNPAERFATCEAFANAVVAAAQNSTSTKVTPRQRNAESSARQSVGRPVASEETSGPAKRSARRSSGEAKRSGRSDITRGEPGLVPCPSCKVELPLKPMHAGRTGKCIHCEVRLTVGRDLASLRRVRSTNSDWYSGSCQLPPKKRKKSASGSSSSSSELILGEKVFGWQIGKRTAWWLASALLVLLLSLTVFLTVHFTGPSAAEDLQEDIQRVRSLE